MFFYPKRSPGQNVDPGSNHPILGSKNVPGHEKTKDAGWKTMQNPGLGIPNGAIWCKLWPKTILKGTLECCWHSEACREGLQKFSLAFSGGGIRAAAFQSGVLWRLAEEGHLQELSNPA